MGLDFQRQLPRSVLYAMCVASLTWLASLLLSVGYVSRGGPAIGLADGCFVIGEGGLYWRHIQRAMAKHSSVGNPVQQGWFAHCDVRWWFYKAADGSYVIVPLLTIWVTSGIVLLVMGWRTRRSVQASMDARITPGETAGPTAGRGVRVAGAIAAVTTGLFLLSTIVSVAWGVTSVSLAIHDGCIVFGDGPVRFNGVPYRGSLDVPLLPTRGFRYGPSHYFDRNDFFFPLWIPFVVALTLTLIYRSQRRRPPGHCRCGYDLTGNVSGKCPECGEETQSQELVAGGDFLKRW